MFFISWGSKMVQLLFGAPETHHCDICQQERTFRKVVTYKVHHLWWIFRWVTGKSYGLICQICRNGHHIDARTAEASLGKNPIPWFDRMGWTMGLGAVGALSVTVAAAGAMDNKRTDAALDNPVAGDVLEVDLAKFEKEPEAPIMYSALLVTKVTADTVVVRLPKTYSNKLTGIQDKVTDGSARGSDFYTDETIAFPRGDLKKLHDDGAIISVVH